MAKNKLSQEDGINERNAAQVVIVMRQSDRRQIPPTNKSILSTSSSYETENLSSPIINALEAERKPSFFEKQQF